MADHLIIQSCQTAAEFAEVAKLFREYAASLAVDLGYQGFEAEVESLPGPYQPPGGDLLLARRESGEICGCVGFRLLSPSRCEMKRLFVRPSARGEGIGLHLTCAVIKAARRQGCAALVLDTLASMEAAQAFYRRLGFVMIAPYYAPTPTGTVFLSLSLSEHPVG